MNNWIFIRGLARPAAHWWKFPDFFKQIFPDDQIEMLDIRGNGEQAHMPSFTSIAENVRDLRARSELLKLGPVHLMTISLGSMIGIEWAHLFPNEIRTLTVINTSDARTSKPWQRLQIKNFPLFLKALTLPNNSIEKELAIFDFTAQNLKNKKQVAAAFAKHIPTSKENILRQLFAASHFQLPEKPNMPILLLSSLGDKMVSPECSRNIEKEWKIKAHWHPSAGHEIPLEEPEWVCEQIRRNLRN